MVSVIIVNYYSANLTKRAVDSVFEYAEDVEVIVVDNTATNEERILLEDLSDTRDIRLIFNPKNEGFARACNQAFIISRGEHILLLNPDAYIIPPCLNILKTFLKNTSDAGAISPQVYWDDDMKYYFPLYPSPLPFRDLIFKTSSLSPIFGKFYSLNERRKNLFLWRSSIPVRVKNLSGGVVLLRKSAIERSGGLFDERFFLFYEDTDLFLRLQKGGYRLYIVSSAKAVHNYYHGNKNKKIEIMMETYSIYLNKHYRRNFLRKILSVMPNLHLKDEYTHLGQWIRPPIFTVPHTSRNEYLFEWSPNSIFSPSIGCFGSGKSFQFSPEAWDFLDKGVYFSRFTPVSKKVFNYETFCWSKDS